MCWTAFIIKMRLFCECLFCLFFVFSLTQFSPLALIYLNCVLKVFLYKQRLRGWHMKVSHNINLLRAARWTISDSCCSEGASDFHIPTLNYILEWADPQFPFILEKRGHKVHPLAKTQEAGSSLMTPLVRERDGVKKNPSYLLSNPSTSPLTPNLFPERVRQ